jgi:hypothetical protein
MEQLVLLLIIGAISLINWLIEQAGSSAVLTLSAPAGRRRQALIRSPLRRPRPFLRFINLNLSRKCGDFSSHLESRCPKKSLLKKSRRKF